MTSAFFEGVVLVDEGAEDALGLAGRSGEPGAAFRTASMSIGVVAVFFLRVTKKKEIALD